MTAPAITNATDSYAFEACFVRVLLIKDRTGTQGPYKTIKVKQELGFWLRTFRFNVFPTHPLYDTIKVDMQLDLKVILVIYHLQHTLFVFSNNEFLSSLLF